MSASLEDRARDKARILLNAGEDIGGIQFSREGWRKIHDRVTDFVAATERATEDARAELNLATSRLNMQLIQAERAAEAARGDVERLREELAVERGQHPADCQPEGCGKCRRQREIEALREGNARLRERLAGAERLVECGIALVDNEGRGQLGPREWCSAADEWLTDGRAFLTPGALDLYECAPCSAKPGAATLCDPCLVRRAKAGKAWKGPRATPAAPVTPADRVFNCPECGPGVYVDEDGCCTTCGRDAPVTPVEPTEVLTVSCPHGPEACDGCLSAAVEGRPLPAVTPKGEPRACTEPAHRHFDLEDACACPDVASEPQGEAPPALCDEGPMSNSTGRLPTHPGGSSSLAVARWLAWKATGKAFDDMSDWGQDRYLEEARALLLADRDAAVSRARAEQLAMTLRRVDQSKPLRPLEHDTEYGKGWRHCYEQIRAQVASLSSTTETQTGGGK